MNVLITGANRGLGLEFCKSYLEKGCFVVATCRDPEKAETLHALKEQFSEALQIDVLNLASEESILQFATRIHKQADGLQFDLVLSNAGVSHNEQFGEWTKASFELNLAVNAVGPALFAQAIAPFLRSGGKLVQLSSGMGSMELNINETAPLDAYAVSKTALNMVTRRLANHLAKREIVVVSIDPGWIRTDMGGPEAPLSPPEAISTITTSIEQLTLAQSGGFLNNQGESIPL